MFESSVDPKVFSLLRRLMKWPYLEQFSLGGGTALALQFGHRESTDLDLFTDNEFDSLVIQNALQSEFADCSIVNITPGSLRAYMGGVKADILKHGYRRLAPDVLGDIRLISLRDLSAMKVNAVSGRGSKKDFADLLLLHENGIPLVEAVGNFREKYGDGGLFSAIRSLNWFEDLRDEPDPRFLNGWTWEKVQKDMARLGKELTRYS